MIDGMLLFAGTTVYSPWFPRQADMLLVTGECIALSNAAVTIELYTKNEEEVGDGAPVDEGESISLSTAGSRDTQEWKTVPAEEGVQQLLRFRYDVASTEAANDWILFRLLPAVWFDAVDAS